MEKKLVCGTRSDSMDKEQLKLLSVLLMNQIYTDIRKIVREEIELAFEKHKD